MIQKLLAIHDDEASHGIGRKKYGQDSSSVPAWGGTFVTGGTIWEMMDAHSLGIKGKHTAS